NLLQLPTEIAKRLNAIIAQILPFLSQEHQQQVATAVERAKQVTMTELNAIIGQQRPDLPRLLQQMHAQQLPHAAHAPPIPMMPHPGLPGPPSIPHCEELPMPKPPEHVTLDEESSDSDGTAVGPAAQRPQRDRMLLHGKSADSSSKSPQWRW
ncbi:hypothetical protein L9F63_007091, partial [Diploptera punctata]